MKKHNFYAGPAILPQSVLKQAAVAALDFKGMGLSILEISHRSPQFVAVLEEARSLVRRLIGLDDDYEVLFLTGGASSQFFMVCANILNDNQTAAYIDSGQWSTKAIKEVENYGKVNVIASSKDKNYTYLPKDFTVPSDSRFLHITTNNTIYGTQFHKLPETSVPLVGDMSSDIFSKPIDYKKYDVIYAGAQKNMGPAGTTLVIIKKDILGKVNRTIPTMLDYRTHIAKGSSFNTPPVFPIYVSMLTLKWVEELGGLKAMAKRNQDKAAILYNEIDRNPLFYGIANKEDRSLMNVPFKCHDESLEAKFLDIATKNGCVGIKGYRTMGGFRASIYNAMEKEGVEKLVDIMQDFEKNS